jgi:hypothetical protein
VTPIQLLSFSTWLNQGVSEQQQGPYFSWQIDRSREPTEALCVGGGALYPRTSHGCNGIPTPSEAVSGASSPGLPPRRQSWSYRHGCAVDALRRASRAAKSAKAGGSAATASPAQAEAASVALHGPSLTGGSTPVSQAPCHGTFRSLARRRKMRAIAIRPDVLHSTRLDRRHYEMALSTLMRAGKKWLAQLITRRAPLERFAEALERRPGGIEVVIDSLQ